jgi:hypothetical protein
MDYEEMVFYIRNGCPDIVINELRSNPANLERNKLIMHVISAIKYHHNDIADWFIETFNITVNIRGMFIFCVGYHNFVACEQIMINNSNSIYEWRGLVNLINLTMSRLTLDKFENSKIISCYEYLKYRFYNFINYEYLDCKLLKNSINNTDFFAMLCKDHQYPQHVLEACYSESVESNCDSCTDFITEYLRSVYNTDLNDDLGDLGFSSLDIT